MRNASGIKVPFINCIVTVLEYRAIWIIALTFFGSQHGYVMCVLHVTNQEAQRCDNTDRLHSLTFNAFCLESLFFFVVVLFFSCCLQVRCLKRIFIKFSLIKLSVCSAYIEITSICVDLMTKNCLTHQPSFTFSLLAGSVHSLPLYHILSTPPSPTANIVKVFSLQKRNQLYSSYLFQ